MSTEEHTPEPGSDKIALTVEIDPTEFFNQAVDRAVDRLLKVSSYDEDGEKHHYPSAFHNEVRSQINDAIKTAVVDKAKEIAEQVLAEPLPQVDTYGQVKPGGQTETLTEKIAAEVKLQIVDRARDHNSYGSRASDSVLHAVIHKEVQEAIAGDLQAELEQARKEVRERVKGKVSQLLEAETLRAAGLK
jgi:hypothetical protein